MARIAKAAKNTKPPVAGRKSGRPARPPASAIKAAVAPKRAPPKRAPVAALPAPKVSKDELRAQVGKLEHANAALRTKSRETNRLAKTAAARITELENQVVRLEKRIAAQSTAAERGTKPASGRPRQAAGMRTIARHHN
jgi:hypothetical protein